MLDAGIYEQLSRLVIAMKQKSGIFRFPGLYAGR